MKKNTASTADSPLSFLHGERPLTGYLGHSQLISEALIHAEFATLRKKMPKPNLARYEDFTLAARELLRAAEALDQAITDAGSLELSATEATYDPYIPQIINVRALHVAVECQCLADAITALAIPR